MSARASTPTINRPSSVRSRLRRDRRVWVGLGVLSFISLAAISASFIAPYNPNSQLDISHLAGLAPSRAHWFGTDSYSRDVLSRMLFGARVSLSIAFASVAIAMTFGTMIGVIAGYFGGLIDALLMRFVDAAFSIPPLLFLLVVAALWGDVGTTSLTLLIASIAWFAASRLVRTKTLVVRDADFVVAAHALGMAPSRILVRHVLPNVIGPAIVAATLAIGNVILLEAGLSYLGIGVRQPQASWGSIIQDGSERVSDLWWLTFFPGVAILITVFACNALGDALRDALDPRQLQVGPDDDTRHQTA